MGYTVAEDDTLEMQDFEKLLEAKIDPITKAIEKLELAQEKIVSLMEKQAVLTTSLANLQDNFRRSSEDNVKIHDILFKSTRDLNDKIEDVKKESGNKLWDVIKIVAAGIFGGIVAWWAAHR